MDSKDVGDARAGELVSATRPGDNERSDLLSRLLALGAIAILPAGAMLLPAAHRRTVVIVLHGEAEVVGAEAPNRHGPGSILRAGCQRHPDAAAHDVITTERTVALLLEERDLGRLLGDQGATESQLSGLVAHRVATGWPEQTAQRDGGADG